MSLSFLAAAFGRYADSRRFGHRGAGEGRGDRFECSGASPQSGRRLTASRRTRGRRASWPRLLTVTFRRSIQTGPVEKRVSRKSANSAAVARWRRAEVARFAASSRPARRAASSDVCRHWGPTHRPRLARGSAYRRQSAAKPVLFQTATFVVSSFHAPRP